MIIIVEGARVSKGSFCECLSSNPGGRASGDLGATSNRMARGEFSCGDNCFGCLGFLGRGLFVATTL